MTWASVVFVDFVSQDQSAYIFIFASIIVVLSLRMMFAFTVMPIVYAGTIPMTAALVLRFGMMDNPFFWALAAMRAIFAEIDQHISAMPEVGEYNQKI